MAGQPCSFNLGLNKKTISEDADVNLVLLQSSLSQNAIILMAHEQHAKTRAGEFNIINLKLLALDF